MLEREKYGIRITLDLQNSSNSEFESWFIQSVKMLPKQHQQHQIRHDTRGSGDGIDEVDRTAVFKKKTTRTDGVEDEDGDNSSMPTTTPCAQNVTGVVAATIAAADCDNDKA